MCLFDWAVMPSGDLHDGHTFQSYVLQNLTDVAVFDLHGLSMLSSAVTSCDSRLQPARLQASLTDLLSLSNQVTGSAGLQRSRHGCLLCICAV